MSIAHTYNCFPVQFCVLWQLLNSQRAYLCVCSYLTFSNTVPLDLNFTHARAQKATARNIHGNAPE